MNPRVSHLLNHPFEVQLTDVPLLQDQIELFPYFSSLRTLLLFGLKEFDHESYQIELKKTSIYSPSRVALYHYLQKEKQETAEDIEVEITEENVIKNEDYVFESYRKAIEVEKQKDEDKIVQLKEESKEEKVFEESTSSEIEVETANEIEKIEEKTEILPQTSEMTFSEWLALTKPKSKGKSDLKSLTEKDIKFQLIDEFIEKSPKISPALKVEEVKSTPSTSSQTAEYSDLMTETLAQIYTEQKMFDKAIKAYKILSLKYPDKKEFFVQKIDQIELQRNS